MAQKSKKFAMTVLRNSIAFLRAKSSGGATSVDGRRDDRRGRHGQHVEVGQAQVHGPDQARAFPHHVDVIGGAYIARAFEARAHVRVDGGGAP